ncbi:MAG: 16S rRNA (guanine(527)-N(7))-methyltransferase RsmG [Campylobacterales bacterium]|nr:16S rRNA (guanine(527)-N(7))-methyltransferase RsmG [Campylobacterales bacterium]
MSNLRDLEFLDEDFFAKSDRFCEEILSWNKIHNLTGKSTKKEIEDLIYDSVYPYSFLPEVKSVLDIGTGAGFPGLCLAFVKPDVRFTLVEPRAKRVSFLNFIKGILKLDNVEIKRDRIENIDSFTVDLVVSKAVSSASALYEMSKDFMDEKTMLLLYKGENTQKEIEDLKNGDIIRNRNSSYLLIKK